MKNLKDVKEDDKGRRMMKKNDKQTKKKDMLSILNF